MEKLYRTPLVQRNFKERESVHEEPLELDNRSFNLEDGDEKTLDYLNYSGTLTKGSLAANGVIKLCPSSGKEFRRDYGAVAVPIKHETPQEVFMEPEEEFDDVQNEWDNIFLKRQDELSTE